MALIIERFMAGRRTLANELYVWDAAAGWRSV
jgi:hypothetical protein